MSWMTYDANGPFDTFTGNPMHADIARRLRSRGWKVGDAAGFLGLSPEESAFVELRFALSRSVRERRLALGVSQVELASRLGSSQSRVAKLEGADATVSIDLLVRSLLALGASRRDIGRALSQPL